MPAPRSTNGAGSHTVNRARPEAGPRHETALVDRQRLVAIIAGQALAAIVCQMNDEDRARGWVQVRMADLAARAVDVARAIVTAAFDDEQDPFS
jgi:hypothetical protein